MSQCIGVSACLHCTILVKHVGRSLRVHVSAHVCPYNTVDQPLWVACMYTVHMLGEGEIAHALTHTCTTHSDIHVRTNAHTHIHISEPGGIKDSSPLKESPIRAAGVDCHPLGRGGREGARGRVCGWLALIVVVGRMQVIVRMLI